jgi:hypothetical protein
MSISINIRCLLSSSLCSCTPSSHDAFLFGGHKECHASIFCSVCAGAWDGRPFVRRTYILYSCCCRWTHRLVHVVGCLRGSVTTVMCGHGNCSSSVSYQNQLVVAVTHTNYCSLMDFNLPSITHQRDSETFMF